MLEQPMERAVMQSALVALDGSPYSRSATSLAIDWAARFGARLVGLGIVEEPETYRPEPVPQGAAISKHIREDAARCRVLDVLADLRDRSKAVGVSADVVQGMGEPADQILREAPRCDVVVLGGGMRLGVETQGWPDTTLGMVLRHSPRPVVVVPRELPEGQGVIVAYGGGRESA